MLGLSVIILFNLIFNVNSNLAESSANCSESESLKIQSVSIKIPNQNLYIVGIVTFSQKLVTDIGDSGDLQKS